MNGEKRISIVLLLFGRYEQQINSFDAKLKELTQLEKYANIIIAGDAPGWNASPHFQMLQLDHPDIKVVLSPEPAIPAKVCNLALDFVETDYVLFSLLEDPLGQRVAQFSSAMQNDSKQHPAEDNGKSEKLPGYYINPHLDSFAGDQFQPNPSLLFGWALTSKASFSFGSFCVPISWIKAVGGFDENPILAVEIERWFSLLVTSEHELIHVAEEDRYVKRLREYPLGRKSPPRDMAVRYASYSRGIAAMPRNHIECAKQFANDLNNAEYQVYSELTGIKIYDRKQLNKRYKVLVVGGIWEYHHEQIAFFNYFERMYGRGFATYRSVYEYDTAPNQVFGYDLVIFVRCRSKNALAMMRTCEEHHISSLYMIDDNWLSIAKDHPKEGSIFMPGSPELDHFIEALGLCKVTWLFNDVLREDVIPYTKCVKKFKISVDAQLFCTAKPRRRTDDSLYIGFSGSLRYDDTAFCALARYARRHKNITVVLGGVLSERQEGLFKNVKTVRIPFSSYKVYAQQIAAVAPDLLIAPLENTRTMNSKCFNKYVESGIAGSACLYSKCKPYTDIIKDGVNGYFVKEETQEGWYQALERILSDIRKLRSVQHTIKQDIMKHYTVDSILPEFCSKLSAIIEEETLKDD